MQNEEEFFSRTHLLGGDAMMSALARCRVLVFGTGGVGSWCVEALARTGVGHIILVDPDVVAPSNINRQLPALRSTLGRSKAQVLAERIADINPDAVVEVRAEAYTAENADTFAIETCDFVVDAIDSLADKADLILRCTDPATAPRTAFVSSMGAARKMHTGAIGVTEFRKVEGCALARALRTYFRKHNIFPKRKFKCVYSPEKLPHRAEGSGGVNGTFMHTTATFGLTLASIIIETIYESTR